MNRVTRLAIPNSPPHNATVLNLDAAGSSRSAGSLTEHSIVGTENRTIKQTQHWQVRRPRSIVCVLASRAASNLSFRGLCASLLLYPEADIRW